MPQLAFIGESDPNFPWEKFPLGQQSKKKKKKDKKRARDHMKSFVPYN